jgi:tetratricopeptide (TPR) repeat protein
LSAVFRASQALLRKSPEECEKLAHEAFNQRFAGHDDAAAHVFGAQLFFIRREQGRLDELVHAVERFAEQYPASWRCAPAYMYAQLGHKEQAREELEALAYADFEDLPRDPFWFVTLSGLCEVVAFLGDARRAQLIYERLMPYADRCVVTSVLCQGSVSRPLGLLATTMSHYDDAAGHFDDALTINTRIRSPLWTAHTQHDYARMLLLRNRPGDGDKALELLNQVLATAQQLGLKALADHARPLMRAMVVSPHIR